MDLTDKFVDTLTPAQLELLCDERHSDDRCESRWLEGSEKKWWEITAHALQISPARILVWCQTDEAGTSDIEVVQGDDALQAATDHVHAIAADLDSRGAEAYAAIARKEV